MSIFTDGCRADDLDGHTQLFGWKFHDSDRANSSNGLVTIFVEDDEWYSPKMTVDRHWLDDLMIAANRACIQRDKLALKED